VTSTTSSSPHLHGVLEDAVRRDPDAIAVRYVDGPSYTRAELLAEARAVAGGLRAAGIGEGDRVALVVSNRSEFLSSYLALSMIGAVSVPINTEMRGDVLTYMLELVGPCSLIIESDLAAQVAGAIRDSGAITQMWAVPCDGVGDPDGSYPFAELSAGMPIETSHDAHPRDLASILFTSGTTGRSKGVMWSHRMAIGCAESAVWVMGFNSDDVVYTCLPLFHINALFTAFFGALMMDAPTVVGKRFSASRYWQEIRDCGATVTNMLGAIGSILWKAAPTPIERDHHLRLAMVVPFPVGYEDDFEKRFGMRITELYGSTDSGIPIGVPFGQSRPGSCGRVTPGWEVQIVDENDYPVPPGTPGEVVTRPTEPWIGQLGYYRQPDKTWEAHSNAWFHTGDILRQDADGWFYFQDRSKDALRVSGENVSSFEVEQAVISHPKVKEAAVFAVPGEHGEDAVMAAIVLEDGVDFEPKELIDFLVPRLAYFAVPRYVEVIPELPKTSTQKVQKAALRQRGVSASTWDGGQRRKGSPRA